MFIACATGSLRPVIENDSGAAAAAAGRIQSLSRLFKSPVGRMFSQVSHV